jgi:hypothetical protein
MAIAAAAAFALIPLQAGVAGELRNCGDGVRASGGVSCAKAKRIAKEYAKTREGSIQGYDCSARRRGGVFKGRCELDNKLILFTFRP